MKQAAEIIGVVVISIGVMFLVSLFFAIPTMLLWNWLIPDIFHLKGISFWQALGLNFLTGIFFRPGSSLKKD